MRPFSEIKVPKKVLMLVTRAVPYTVPAKSFVALVDKSDDC